MVIEICYQIVLIHLAFLGQPYFLPHSCYTSAFTPEPSYFFQPHGDLHSLTKLSINPINFHAMKLLRNVSVTTE